VRFDLRKPCPQCPFRPGGFIIHPDRAREIAEGVVHGDVTFTCHKHLHGEHLELEDGEERYNPAMQDQHCAGAAAFVRKLGAANQMLQIAERLGICDPDQLLPEADAEVYDDIEAMVAAHAAGS
jgi:hypothetical protein